MPLRLFLVIPALLALAGPAMAQERQWSLDASDEDAYLIFGVPDSDDVGISFWCPIRQGKVNVFVPEAGEALKPEMQVPLTIAADGKTFSLAGRTEANLEAGTTSVEAQLAEGDPIFAALKTADRFRVKAGTAEELIFPLIDADLAGLLELCRKE